MTFQKLLIVPLLAAALVATTVGGYTSGVAAQQNARSAHSKKTTQFHYVCPMHEDITSKKPGTCPKCKMKLVRKPIAKESTADSN
jgi:Heavy metal binding domain